MFKLIVFDWDDVITLGATEGYIACYHKAIIGIGVNIDPKIERQTILHNWGKTYKEEIRAVVGNHSELDEAVEIFKEEFFADTFINHLTLVDGVNQLLLKLSEKYKLAVATGNHPDLLVKKIIPRFNIPEVFSKIMYSSRIPSPEYAKPHPYMLKKIMEGLNCLSNETLYVGDAQADVEMANNAGVKVAVVLTGHLNSEQAKEMRVWKIIDEVTDLEKIL